MRFFNRTDVLNYFPKADSASFMAISASHNCRYQFSLGRGQKSLRLTVALSSDCLMMSQILA